MEECFFPFEIFHLIFSYLTPRDLCKFERTCKTLKELARNEKYWKWRWKSLGSSSKPKTYDWWEFSKFVVANPDGFFVFPKLLIPPDWISEMFFDLLDSSFCVCLNDGLLVVFKKYNKGNVGNIKINFGCFVVGCVSNTKEIYTYHLALLDSNKNPKDVLFDESPVVKAIKMAREKVSIMSNFH